MPLKKQNHLPTLPSLLWGRHIPLIHRDISWLQFNERVLHEARSASNPALERVKFLAISASNLDEFFMVRFQSLKGKSGPPISVRRRAEIRANMLEDIAEFGGKQIEAFDRIIPELDAAGLHIITRIREQPGIRDVAKSVFEKELLANLPIPERFSPIDLRRLGNLEKCIIFPEGMWVRVPKTIPEVFAVAKSEPGSGGYFFLQDDLLLTFLGTSLSTTGSPVVLRMTRDSDYSADLEEHDPASIPDIVRRKIGRRELGTPVRVQYRGELETDLIPRAMRALRLSASQFIPAAGTLCLHGLWTVYREAKNVLNKLDTITLPTPEPVIPRSFTSSAQIFSQLPKHDFLLHHPYDAFQAFEEWLRTACRDAAVECVELTIYRSSPKSALKEALKKAAATKKVRVFIELRARFDELNNLLLAEELRDAGVEVFFGFGALKLHAKIALVTRRGKDGAIECYTHLSTGNYNAETARQYTDLAILTANPEIAADARIFFDALMAQKVPKGFKRLVTAPDQLHKKLLQHIQLETEAAKRGEKTKIIAKVNALVDEKVISALYEASAAGVAIDLIVRGACSLVPGVTKLSRNIRVISLVDRYLEHSRIYFFESQRAMYLSSADLMPRNLYSRLEIAFPVIDQRIYDFIKDVLFPTYLQDNQKAWELTQLGTWKKKQKPFGAKPARAQSTFEALAATGYRDTPLFDRTGPRAPVKST